MRDFFKKVMKSLFHNGFLYSILCLIGGLLFAFWSENAVSYIAFALMGLIAIYGIFCIFKYFIAEKETSVQALFLFQGIFALEIDAPGVACFCGLRNIPLLIYLGFVGMISTMRFQCMADMKRREVRVWYVFLIISILLLLLGLVPFVLSVSTKTLYLIIGITLLVEFVDDFFCRIIIKSMDEY